MFMQMSYARIAVLAFCLSFFTFHATAEPLSDKDKKFVEAALTEYQQVAIRVEFDDPAVGRNIARGFEPMVSKFDEGYLILILDGEEYTALEAAAESMSIRTSYDLVTMQRYIFERPDFGEARAKLGLDTSSLVSAQSFNGVVYPSIPGFACYRTVEGTYSTAQDIVAAFPNLATWADIGDSWEKTVGQGGYDIQALTLTNSAITGPKPAILMTGGIHAREYTPVELLIRFAEELVTGYGNDADITWILDNHIVHIIPIANPDGRKRAETGLLWRKNVNENYCGATSNTRGADLNRNFQFAWGCCGGSSATQCNQTYRGPFAASEPETQAVQNFLFNNFIDNRGPNITDAAPLTTEGMYIDIHSSGQFVLWPWGFSATPTPNGTGLQTLGRKLAFPNGHSPEQAASSFTTDGETDSFGYGELGLPSYTYELGTEFFQACNVFENTIVPDNFESLMYALKVLRSPYVTPAGPDSRNLSLSVTSAVPAGTSVDISATADDTQYNNSNGTEPTQNITNTEYYLDVPPWEAGASANPLSANDGSFNSSTETATASIDTSSLSEGRHTIYVRSQDATGTWGAVSAIFLDIDNSASVPVTIFSDDFESDQGWTTNPGSTDTATTGQWERGNPEQVVYQGSFTQLPDSVSGTNNLVTGRLAGPGIGSFDIDNGVTSIRSPNIAIPAGAQSVNLSLSQYFYHSSNSSTADFLRISVIGNTTSIVLDERGTNSTRPAAWSAFNADLTGFAGQTVYILIEAADASNGSLVEAGIDDVVITGVVSAPSNQAPTVDAGTDASVSLPDTASLTGSASDDGLPNNSLTTSWSQVSGPGTVVFGDANAVATSATFSVDGTYVLRLTANDGDLSSTDDVTITVAPENQAPTVSAGSNQTVTLPDNATLSGTASDDDLPSNSLTTTWSQVSGPGTVTFGNANALNTSASFSVEGSYTLRLTADDGELTSTSDIIVTVNPEPVVNQAPTVSAGSNQTITLPSDATLLGTASDDDLPSSSLTTTWSVVSGPGAVTFGNANALNTSASFSADGTYTLRLTADDSELTSSSDVIITVNPEPPVNQPPTVSAGPNQTITLPGNAALTGSATDDGQPSNTLTTTWSVVSGPGSVVFGNANALATSASFSAAGSYTLRLTANDTALSSSSDVIVTVNPAPPINQAPTVSAGSDQTVTLPGSANLSGSVSDDGLPGGALSSAWSQISGPGTASFGDTASATTSVDFSSSGTYVLRLTGNDGALVSSDDITITVQPEPPINQAPTANAGNNQTITLPASATLTGASSDDGLPSGTLTNQWSLVSGPGTANFVDSSSLNTTVSFSAIGSYVLRLTVNDGVLTATDDITIQVDPAPVSDNFETLVLPAVNTSWLTLSFTNTYSNPVVVCTPQYSTTDLPAVVRVRNVSASSFDVKVQNPSDSALNDVQVFCLAMESGSWTLPDGRLIEAQSYNSSAIGRSGSWSSEVQSYLNSYTNPVVFGQVMTNNDNDWSTFWSRGASQNAAPNATNLRTGKQVAEDSDITRANEIIGFIVIEAGNGSAGGSDYTAQLGSDSIRGTSNGAGSYNFSTTFSTAPAFAIATMAAMDGGNGGWAFLNGASPLSTNSMSLAIDEDQIRDSERAHTTEQVGYLVFENSVSLTLTPNP